MKNDLKGEKYLWRAVPESDDVVFGVARRYNLAIPIAQTLITRGYTTSDAIDAFLFATAADSCADPRLLKDAEKAVERLERAIAAGEKILIAGDYDVDGVTSSALMLTCLLPLNATINFFLPHRQRDGYGLSVKTIERAAAHGYTVVITVDNGITAYEPARVARSLGIDLIITDHHRPHAELPDAYAIVDPHQATCSYPFKHFAGVGVIFKLMSLLYQRRGLEMPAKVYELLMLGTVADVVPLQGENRFWVRYGLQQVNGTESLAMRSLKCNAKFTKTTISSLDVGFYFAPQINALGRLDDARAAVGFLLGDDEDKVMTVGTTLAELNSERKRIEQGIVQDVITSLKAEAIDVRATGVLVATGSSWPAGVVGLAASRLVGMYGRPAIVLHLTADGIAKGSCRSIPEINMFQALESVKDLLLTFGGHPMAAGLSLEARHIPALRERLHAYVAERVVIADLRQKLYLDAELTLPDVSKKLFHDMSFLEPFGAENREPLFLVQNVVLVNEPTLLKDVHVKCMIFADGVMKSVIFFNRPELYERLKKQGTEPFSVAVSVTENQWNGRTNIELCGLDVAGLIN